MPQPADDDQRQSVRTRADPPWRRGVRPAADDGAGCIARLRAAARGRRVACRRCCSTRCRCSRDSRAWASSPREACRDARIRRSRRPRVRGGRATCGTIIRTASIASRRSRSPPRGRATSPRARWCDGSRCSGRSTFVVEQLGVAAARRDSRPACEAAAAERAGRRARGGMARRGGPRADHRRRGRIRRHKVPGSLIPELAARSRSRCPATRSPTSRCATRASTSRMPDMTSNGASERGIARELRMLDLLRARQRARRSRRAVPGRRHLAPRALPRAGPAADRPRRAAGARSRRVPVLARRRTRRSQERRRCDSAAITGISATTRDALAGPHDGEDRWCALLDVAMRQPVRPLPAAPVRGGRQLRRLRGGAGRAGERRVRHGRDSAWSSSRRRVMRTGSSSPAP